MGLSSIGARAGGIIAPLVVLLVGVHLRRRVGPTVMQAGVQDVRMIGVSFRSLSRPSTVIRSQCC